MIDVYEVLKGCKITGTEQIHDYVQLGFSNGAGISIYNDYEISNGTLQDLIGRTVEDFRENDQKVLFSLDNGSMLTVFMHDDAFNGPEAMQFDMEWHPTVVWRGDE